MSEWRETSLGEVARITIGRTPPRKDPRYWTTDLERPFCTIADMTGWSVSPQREGVTALAEAEGKAKRVPAGALLMSFKLSIGKVGFAACDVFPNEAIAWLRADEELIDPTFLAFALEAQDLTVGSGRAVKGNTLNGASLRAISLPLPPLAEQRRIVDLIVTADAHLAALRDEIDRADHVYSGMRESLVNGPCRRLGEVLLAIDAGRSPWTTGDPPRDNEPAVLKVSAVAPLEFRPTQSKVLPSDHQMSKAWEVRPGDVLITRANTPDRVGAVCRAPDDTRPELYLCDKTLRLRPNLEIRADYLTEALNLRSVRRHLMSASTGTSKSMFNISQDAIRLTEIPVPRLETQADVAESLELARSTVRSLGDELAALTDARSATLVALLTREIEIPGSYDALVESA